MAETQRVKDSNFEYAQRIALHWWALRSGDVRTRDEYRQRGVEAFRIAIKTFDPKAEGFREALGAFVSGVMRES